MRASGTCESSSRAGPGRSPTTRRPPPSRCASSSRRRSRSSRRALRARHRGVPAARLAPHRRRARGGRQGVQLPGEPAWRSTRRSKRARKRRWCSGSDGQILEGASSNIFIVKDGTLRDARASARDPRRHHPGDGPGERPRPRGCRRGGRDSTRGPLRRGRGLHHQQHPRGDARRVGRRPHDRLRRPRIRDETAPRGLSAGLWRRPPGRGFDRRPPPTKASRQDDSYVGYRQDQERGGTARMQPRARTGRRSSRRRGAPPSSRSIRTRPPKPPRPRRREVR